MSMIVFVIYWEPHAHRERPQQNVNNHFHFPDLQALEVLYSEHNGMPDGDIAYAVAQGVCTVDPKA